ncbi:trypsin-like serine peptidase [Bradyrhizobium sp. AZCC 1693]|uniref:trypsin-like serine peptidase n=1 Tax=Bradyrhizobium sp. AZCC 1693 TaxID=3117029 RepID=UPI002FF1C1C3
MVIAKSLLGCFVISLPVIWLELSSGVTPQLAARADKASVSLFDGGHRQIVDARFSPYSAVGKFKGTMTCTAAMILDPRIIVTAAHCIMERDGTIRESSFSFQPGYRSANHNAKFDATVWAVGSRQSAEHETVRDAARDWAILVLDRAPLGVKPFALSRHPIGTLGLSELQLQLPAYSDDIGDAEALSVDPACAVRDLVWDTLIHNCTGGRGSSGAPLLVREERGYAIIGIQAASIFEGDQTGHIARFVGGQAIGSWMFMKAALASSRQLNAEPVPAVSSGDY